MSYKNGIPMADVKRETTDVCIIGAGAAGVRAAYEAGQQRQKLQELMWRDAHIVRNEEGLQRAKAGVTAMLEELPDVAAPDTGALRGKVSSENMFYTSLAIIEAALTRKETRGPHYREDYPERDEAMEKPIYLRWDGKKVTVNEEG